MIAPPHAPQTGYDALAIELYRHAMLSVVDELEVNLSRTAYSPLIYEYKDYCIGFIDADFRLLGQSRGSLPIFVADLGISVRDAAEIIGTGNLEPGDIFITNYAAVSGQHLNNVVVATPVFDAAGLLGYIAIRAHWADVGGMSYGSVTWASRDIFQEGIQYRGLRVYRRGEPVPEVLRTIEANTRAPKLVLGDLNAQIGACLLGAKRWRERISDRWSPVQLRELAGALLVAGSEMAYARVRELLPDGAYEARCLLDDAGTPGSEPVELVVAFTVDDGSIVVDLSRMPAPLAVPMNAGRTATVSALRLAFKALLAPESPIDEGFFAPITVEFGALSMLDAAPTAAMSFWNNSMASLIDLVFRAVGEKRPELVPAGHHASMSAYALFGEDPNGTPWMTMDTAEGGRGGSQSADGFSPLKTLGHGDTRDIPIESVESRYPLFVHGYRFIPQSGGAGLHRGGDGTEKTIEIQADHVTATFSLDRTVDPPWGINGGGAGQPGDVLIQFPDRADTTSCKRGGPLPLPRGTVFTVRTSGGGGWGTPG